MHVDAEIIQLLLLLLSFKRKRQRYLKKENNRHEAQLGREHWQ